MNLTNLAQVNVLVSIIVFLIVIVALFTVLKGKSGLSRVESIVKGVEGVVSAIEPVANLTPAAPVVHVIDEVFKSAEKGVHYAEQLYSAGKVIDRKTTAVNFVEAALLELNVKVTDTLKGVVDGAVEAAVNLLPPTVHPPQAEAAPAPVADAAN